MTKPKGYAVANFPHSGLGGEQLQERSVCRTYGAWSLELLWTQGFHPGLGVCRAYGAGASLNRAFLPFAEA